MLTIIAVRYQSKILMRADWLLISTRGRAKRFDMQVTLKPANAFATRIAVFSSFQQLSAFTGPSSVISQTQNKTE